MSSVPDNLPDPDQAESVDSEAAPREEKILGVEAKISPDGLVARVAIPKGVEPHDLSVELLERYARGRGVKVTEEVRDNLAKAIRTYSADPTPQEIVIARATPPAHGEDGRLEWVERFDPSLKIDEEDLDDEEANVDFYNQTSYVAVKTGDHVATIYQPTRGTDGVDVTGTTIPARPGRPAPIRVDESLEIEESGRVLAARPGVLLLAQGILQVVELLEVKNYVDFSVGNIRFDGSVVVRQGVRDRFLVHATGDVVINGLVEAASIIAGGNLVCRRGMAGKDRGQVMVGGDAEAGYFDNVRARIQGNLTVRRELMDCGIMVGRNLTCSQGSIIGGQIVVTGVVKTSVLGSPAGTPTLLTLGETPFVTAQMQRLERMRHDFERKLEGTRTELEALEQQSGPALELSRPRIEELIAAVAELESRIEACRTKHEELVDRRARMRFVDLRVSRLIHPNVQLRADDRDYVFTNAIKGPLRICWNRQRRLIVQLGDGSSRPIFEFAHETNMAA